MSSATEFDPYALPPDSVQEPPVSLWLALRKIGPGIILAGTIVGSGELLLTTSLGAKHGFIFLWLLLFSCVIKVFVQIELGRYAISSGKPTLAALNELPGPRLGAHWTTWWWLCMMLCTLFQHGAMTAIVGQSLNEVFPSLSPQIAEFFSASVPVLSAAISDRPEFPWAVATCLTAVLLLWTGNYRRIETITTVLVVGVTFLTMTAACALPFTDYPIHWDQVAQGLTFQLPAEGMVVAFSVFGITGVGASELFYYPYWCLEKGYARYVGRCENTADWERRAKGWIRVLHLDAWVSMLVFTISTLAFYFMGAAVLFPRGLDPKGKDMILTLSEMFVASFGLWTRVAFLIGAGAVLFKTLYLSCAGNARLTADFLGLAKILTYKTPEQRASVIHRLSIFYPFVALGLFILFKDPKAMLVVGGVAQALTLPIISAAAIYFRYRRLDRRISPSLLLDILLWTAFVLITLLAGYTLWEKLMGLIAPSK